MPKTVTATEAKTRFGAMVSWALEEKDDVIVESHGVPKVAIVPYEEYAQIQSWREKERRKRAIAEIEKLRKSVRARNQDLTEEQAIALADRLVRDTIDRMVEDGRVTFSE